MKLGIGSYTLPWAVGVPGYPHPSEPLTAEGLVQLAHEHGVTLVQIADNLPLHTFTTERLSDLSQLAKSYGIELEIGTRGTAPELLQEYLRIAELLSAKTIRTIISTPNIEDAKHEIRQVLTAYEKQGVTLAIENHDRHTTEQLIEVFESLNSNHVGVCLDTVNSFGVPETPDHVIDKLSPYLKCLHIKDFSISRVDHLMGFMVLGTPAGSGMLDIHRLRDIAQRSDVQANAILEQWPVYTGSVDQTILQERKWFIQSLQFLRSVGFTE